ncbi:MAG: hypothetical protein ACXVC7_17320 [Bacteroidia bacterium]
MLLTEVPQEFELNLLFKDYKSAIDAFNQLGNYFEILTDLDKAVLRNIHPNLLIEYGLEDLEYGSIKTKLRQLIKAIPDDVINNFDLKYAIGYLAVKAKYQVLKLLGEEKVIDTKKQIEKVTDKINKDIVGIGAKYNLIVTEINNYTVLNSLDTILKETNQLKDKEALEFKSSAGNVKIREGGILNKPKILSELGQTTIINETTEVLKIKKVDMLSFEAKWDFLNGKKKLTAKISDMQWLHNYHNRIEVIQPEDALMVTLKTTHSYTPNFEDKSTDHEIVKVLRVIKPDETNNAYPFI